MKLTIFAHPNSKKPRVEKDLLGSLHVYVAAPPLEGKANQAVQAALAEHLGISKSKIVLVKGNKGKQKVFEIK